MIKIEKAVVFGWEAAVRGMRNPMNSWDKSDSGLGRCVYHDDKTLTCGNCYEGYHGGCPSCFENYALGENDYELMMKLAANGAVHAKFRRMIIVTCDITAPLYWWKEFDTYKVGTVANSCSTMHKIHAKPFELDDFSHEHLDSFSIVHLKDLVSYLNDMRLMFNCSTDVKKKDFWWQMIQLLPSSYNQRRTVQMNYEMLANVMDWRQDHKLDEWREFCRWAKTLPYAEVFQRQ